MEYKHVPVMLKEVIEYLQPKKGQYFFDGTLGGGGYTVEISKLVGEKGKVLATDLDEMAIENFKFKILNLKLNNINIYHGNFKDISKISEETLGSSVRYDGIVLDLGLSSAQLEDRSRGFSFRFDAPLDMAFGETADGTCLRRQGRQTADIINKTGEKDLEKIIREYGEERFAGRIAKGIVEARKLKEIKTTKELVEIIADAVPANYKNNPKINFATRTFQALRIATNRELDNLKEFLPQAVELLKPRGRLVVVSFHSLEDRIIKEFFKTESINCLCPPRFPVCQCGHKASLKIITRKPITPASEESNNNPRARSAKLRVAEKIV
ncbi:MAG: 16S rRNA (cytosine(1402)-N(4))-methyltransferase RsmH [Patescibacteria group bacterium]|nr:16S rRNA (cytosine(1402)-N(4))-methyltransferase RsmH [Patescibacteria group bacterium]MDD4610951.1 16S rRNA (cytosine(1402)-N(4))-methyltransferase RsmH [Patescibacteria group bacterium]